jgi:CheY-like chemotaxis protein
MKAILFVDDHELLARLSCEILEMQGYRAVSA